MINVFSLIASRNESYCFVALAHSIANTKCASWKLPHHMRTSLVKLRETKLSTAHDIDHHHMTNSLHTIDFKRNILHSAIGKMVKICMNKEHPSHSLQW